MRQTLLLCATLVSFSATAAFGQDDVISASLDQLQVLNESVATASLSSGSTSSGAVVVSPPLTIWSNQVLAYDGAKYIFSMVGRSPFNRGATTTTIPTVIIPLIVNIGTFSFDPTAPDDGCLGAAGNTATVLTQQSPIFQNAPITMNGVNVGNTQYIDAFQRANFWQYVQPTGNSYHTMLAPTLAATQTLTYASTNSTTSAVFGVGGTQCGSSPGPVNQKARLGVVNINVINSQLQTIITNLGLTPSQFPLFIIYKTVLSNGSANVIGNCCILGYHNSLGPSVTNPGQTFGIAEFDTGTVFRGTTDASVLAHEVGEWMDDPSGRNPTPVWGGIGQVGGCQNNLEVGDPLSGTLAPGILMPNGFTYHMQELAFFSWFYNGNTIASIGAGGKFSSNGTFSGGAKPCPPGGTN